MPRLTYRHDCPEGCPTPGVTVEVLPETNGNVMFVQHPYCVATRMELPLICWED